MLMINLVLLQNQFFEPVESVFGFSPIAFPPPAMYGGGNCGGLLGCQPPPSINYMNYYFQNFGLFSYS
jgi:hypothetical protein